MVFVHLRLPGVYVCIWGGENLSTCWALSQGSTLLPSPRLFITGHPSQSQRGGLGQGGASLEPLLGSSSHLPIGKGNLGC